MRSIGIILVLIRIILGVFTFSMDTTVAVGAIGLGHSSVAVPPQRGHNLGLIDERRTLLTLSGLLVVVGVILYGFGTLAAQKAHASLQRARPERAPIHESSTKNEAVDSCIAVLTSLGYKVTTPKQDQWAVKLPDGDGRLFFYFPEQLQDFTTRVAQSQSGKDLP